MAWSAAGGWGTDGVGDDSTDGGVERGRGGHGSGWWGGRQQPRGGGG
jgi:hypothetical protein